MPLTDTPTQAPADARLRYYDLLGRRIYVRSREARQRTTRPLSFAVLFALIGLAVTAFHELTYRQTGGDDFPVLHVVSHAGGDMLMLLGILLLAAVLAPLISERGIR